MHKICHGHQCRLSAQNIYIHTFLFFPGLRQTSGQHPPEGGVRFLNTLTREKVPKSIKSFKTIISHVHVWNTYHSLHILHIRHPKKIIIIKILNDIFYHITSASLSWNPFIHFLHTIDIFPPPDILTGWHILWFDILCLYNTSLNQTKNRDIQHSWCHYTKLHSLPPRSVSIRLYHWPEGQGPFPHLLCGAPDTYVLKALSTPDSIPWPHVVCDTQSLDKWNIIIFYIINCPPTTPFLSFPHKCTVPEVRENATGALMKRKLSFSAINTQGGFGVKRRMALPNIAYM